MITETKNKMIATVKMIFAISIEMTATPPKAQDARDQSDDEKSNGPTKHEGVLRIDGVQGIMTIKKKSNEFSFLTSHHTFASDFQALITGLRV